MLIASALGVAATWVLITVVLIGLGSVLLKLFEIDLSLIDAFWMGLAVSIAILEIWNLLLPVTGSATTLLFCFGILGWITNRSVLWNRLSLGLRTSRWLILLQIAVVLFLALRAVGPCIHYDTGLYGASAVRWILTYPTVPGLANLYVRLGFNSSAYLCLAALDTGVWKGFEFSFIYRISDGCHVLHNSACVCTGSAEVSQVCGGLVSVCSGDTPDLLGAARSNCGRANR